MQSRIRWAGALAIASSLTLFVAGTLPAAASTRGAKATSRAKALVGQARGRTLIFGGGDSADIGLGVAPSEPIANLETILANAGFGVDTSSTLPNNLMQYRAIWYIDTNPLTSAQQSKLEAFVDSGRGLYLTGEADVCCTPLDNADGTVINDLVTGGGIEVGGLGGADSPSDPNPVTGNAIDSVAVNPNVLTTWTPSSPGGIGGVAPANEFTSTDFGGQPKPTGAVWDGASLLGGAGRLAILMDINWLESEFWDQPTAIAVALNIERFLMSATPVPVGFNSQFSGYAAKAHGVHDVNGEWMVPTVDCSQSTLPSAVGIWVGIDGYGNDKLVKAGVGVTCRSPQSAPCYYTFTEVSPGAESPSACSSVQPGDDIAVDVTNSTFGTSRFIVTMTDNGNPVAGSPFTLVAPTKRDKSAECVVQLPPGTVGPSPSAHYTALADFAVVTFTSCAATATQNAGSNLDTDQLATGSDGAFTVNALNLGNPRKTKAAVGGSHLPDLSWNVTWLRAK
jgi:hypothetical protein